MVGYKNGVPMIVDTSKYGVTIMPEPIYEYPKEHPCSGCIFVFHVNKPSCMTGSYPGTENCINAFYKRMLERRCEEKRAKLNLKAI